MNIGFGVCAECGEKIEHDCDDAPDMSEQIRDALTALKTDAERYRWLKSRPGLRISWHTSGGEFDPVGTLGNFDSMLDDARAASKPHEAT